MGAWLHRVAVRIRTVSCTWPGKTASKALWTSFSEGHCKQKVNRRLRVVVVIGWVKGYSQCTRTDLAAAEAQQKNGPFKDSIKTRETTLRRLIKSPFFFENNELCVIISLVSSDCKQVLKFHVHHAFKAKTRLLLCSFDSISFIRCWQKKRTPIIN